MKKTVATITAAAVVLAALTAAYLFAGRAGHGGEAPKSPGPEADARIVLIDKDKEKLGAAFFYGGTSVTVILPWMDEGGQNRVSWMVDGYEGVNLNSSVMDKMVEPLCGLTSDRMISDGDDGLAEYGLEYPDVVAVGQFYDGSETKIYLGAMTPTKDYYYVRVDGTPGVYLMDATEGARLTMTVNDMAYKASPYINFGAVVYVYIIQKDGREMVLSFDGDRGETDEAREKYGFVPLTMYSPYPGIDADNDSVAEILLESAQEVTFLRAVEVAPPDYSAYGFDEPELIIFLIDEDGNEYCLYVGDDASTDAGNETVYAMVTDRPVVFEVAKETLRAFYNVNPFMFIDRRIFKDDPRDAELIRMELAGPGLDYEILPRGGEGGVPLVNGAAADADLFRAFFDALTNLSYDAELKDQSMTGDLFFTARIYYDGGASVTAARFYNYSNDFYAASAGDYPALFVVNKRSINSIVDTLETLTASSTN